MPGAVHSLAFSPNGKIPAVGCSAPAHVRENLDDGLVALWNWKTGEKVGEIRQDGLRHRDSGASDVQNLISSTAFSPDGTMLATADERGARLWKVESQEELARFEVNGTSAAAVVFSRDGSLLYCAMGSDVKVIDVKRLTEQEQLDGNSGKLYGIALAPDGLTLAAASLGNRIVLWNTKTGVRREVKSNGVLYAVAFSPKGNLLVSTGSGGAKLWRLNSDRPKTLELDLYTFPYSTAFSPNGEVLALIPIDLTSEKPKRALTLWNPTTGGRLATTAGPYRVAAFSPDGVLRESDCIG